MRRCLKTGPEPVLWPCARSKPRHVLQQLQRSLPRPVESLCCVQGRASAVFNAPQLILLIVCERVAVHSAACLVFQDQSSTLLLCQAVPVITFPGCSASTRPLCRLSSSYDMPDSFVSFRELCVVPRVFCQCSILQLIHC